MAPQLITLVRHGQAEHNVRERYHLPDPFLTTLGESQCNSLPTRFPSPTSSFPPIDLVVSSPLKRTLQTTLLGFAPQIASGIPIIVMPELQETSELPCDTGSCRDELEKVEAFRGIDFTPLDEARTEEDGDWNSKRGKWGSDQILLEKRARWVRRWLQGRNEKHIVCVLHGGLLHYLTEDWTGHGTLPGTGWTNTEFRTYVQDNTDNAGLTETEESKQQHSHTEKPLGKTEQKQLEQTVGNDQTGPAPEEINQAAAPKAASVKATV